MSDEIPSVNPKIDAFCEMMKTIHDLQEENKRLTTMVDKMKSCELCKKHNWQGCTYDRGTEFDCVNNKRAMFELKE